MDTKNVKDIKINNSDTVKVMANNEVLWQKEEPWIPVKGPVSCADESNIVYYYSHQLRKGFKFKIVEFRINLSMIEIYGDPFCDFMDCINENGENLQKPTRTIDINNGIYRLAYKNSIVETDELAFVFKKNITGKNNAEIEKMMDLKFRIIE